MAIKQTTDLLNFYNENAAAMYEAAFAFGQKELAPLNASLDATNTFPEHLWKLMGEQGFLGVNMPEQYGGADAGFLAQIAVTAGISYHSGSVGLSQLAHVDLCMGRIVKHGTEEQKEKYLPQLISGEHIGALAISEPNAGSDAMSARTTATKEFGGYILDGEKTWITNGGKADVLVVYAKTSERKLTAFIVEKDMKGFNPSSKIDKIGMRGSETYSLHFDNCFVREKNILGKVNCGGHILMDGFNTERMVLSAAAIGLAESSLDAIVKYTTERQQFGKPLNANQAVAFDIADMHSRLWSVKNYVYSMAAMYDKNPQSLTNELAASAFLEAGRMGEEITTKCVKLAGGMGYTKDMRFGQNMNDMLLYQIGGGTENIRRLVIANAVINEARLALAA